MIGLGKMGANMATRLIRAGHSVSGYDASEEAVARGVPAPVIASSLFSRFSSRDPDAFANKLLAALKNQFGGHAVKAEGT
ncbi:MAG: NAD(P)-binding domain-containing protein [Acidimicrobiales bacterium]